MALALPRRIVRRCPTLIALPERRFACFSAETVVRYNLAIENNVSPRLTRCVSRLTPLAADSLSTAGGRTLLATTASTDRDSVTGAGESVRAARMVVGARGMINCCPAPSFALVVR